MLIPVPAVDVPAHFLPPSYRKALQRAGIEHPDGFPYVPDWSVTSALELMEQVGIEAALLSISSPGLSFVDAAELSGFGAFDSPLGHHPDHVLVPGVEISSGSLGHGLPIAVGMALALDAQGRGGRVVVLVGDAELDEGSNWEAVQLAGRLGLGRLTAVAVDNRSSTYHWPGGLDARFAAEGWDAERVDGRDHDALERALAPAGDRPNLVVAEVSR